LLATPACPYKADTGQFFLGVTLAIDAVTFLSTQCKKMQVRNFHLEETLTGVYLTKKRKNCKDIF